MKVLFLAKYYPPAEGGIERYSHMLCSDLVQRGIDVEVIAASDGPSREEVFDGVKVNRLHVQFVASSTPIILELPAMIRDKIDGCDLVHLNFPNPWTDLLYLMLGRKSKAVMTYHCDIYRDSMTLSGLALKAYQPFIHRVLQRVSAIIATSPNIIEHSPFLSGQQERCHTIPMPIDQAVFAEPDPVIVDEMRSKYGDFALFVGRLVYYKGLNFLVEAMQALEKTNLVIFGKGPLENDLRQQVKELGLEQKIHFEENLSDDRRLALYHTCRCFVLPSIAHAEGFGIVLAEAMACGRPVISTELMTGTSYVNLDGVTGYVVPPRDPAALADKIDLLVGNAELSREMGDRGRMRSEQEFTRDIVTEKTIALYKDVLTG